MQKQNVFTVIWSFSNIQLLNICSCLFKTLIIGTFTVFCLVWHLIWWFYIYLLRGLNMVSLSKLWLIFIVIWYDLIVLCYLNNTLLSAFSVPSICNLFVHMVISGTKELTKFCIVVRHFKIFIVKIWIYMTSE